MKSIFILVILGALAIGSMALTRQQVIQPTSFLSYKLKTVNTDSYLIDDEPRLAKLRNEPAKEETTSVQNELKALKEFVKLVKEKCGENLEKCLNSQAKENKSEAASEKNDGSKAEAQAVPVEKASKETESQSNSKPEVWNYKKEEKLCSHSF
jgi:hypothetical protein